MVNLMDMIKGAVSGQVMKQMGGLLGVEEKKTAGLFENAAGAIMGGLMKKAGTDQGASDVFDMVNKQDSGIMDKLGDLLGGGKEEEFMKQGGGILDGIMGGNSQSTSMIGTISKALGFDKGIISKLLMMAAPMVLGVIGKHVKSKALDMVGLKSLLGGQAKHVAGALPSGLGDQLGFGNLLSNVTNSAGNVASSAGNVASSAGNVASSAASKASDVASSTAASGGSLLKTLIPLLLLAGLIIAGAFYLPNLMGGKEKPAERTQITATNLEDYTGKISKQFGDLTTSVVGIKDVEGAEKVATSFGKTTDFLSGLDFSGVGKEGMAGLTSSLNMNDMRGALDTAYETEGIGAKIKEVLSPCVKKLVDVINVIKEM